MDVALRLIKKFVLIIFFKLYFRNLYILLAQFVFFYKKNLVNIVYLERQDYSQNVNVSILKNVLFILFPKIYI